MPEQFKVGERVRFLRERQEGVVQRILSAHRIEVLIDDFVEMEVDAADVVRINANEQVFKKEEEERAAPKGLAPISAEREPTFVVQRTPDRDYELHILNHSRRDLFFTAFQKVHGKFKGINAAHLIPGERRMIAKLNTHEFHMVQAIILQVMQYPAAEKARPMPLLSLEIDAKAEILNTDAVVVPDVGAEGWEFILQEKAIAQHEEEQRNQPNPFVKPNQFGPEVIDLHIEKLVDSLMGVSSAQMLQIQMENFEKAISDAQLRKAKQLVFIHGTGSGKLRKELHERLRNYKFVKSYEQADPLRYGNGATLVFFA